MAVMEVRDIMRILPQRYPYLMIDRVLELNVEGEISEWRVVVLKNVSADAPWAGGHFPEDPVMPGTAVEEVMAQGGAVLLSHLPESASKVAFNAGWEEVRHRAQIRPGDQLIIEASGLRMKGDLGKGKVVAKVEGKVVSEGVLKFGRLPRE